MKQYPLELENVGEDVYMLMSRGHHDKHEFMRKVRAEGWTWPLGMPTHEWMKVTPTRVDGLRCVYSIVPEGTRGAIPVTYTREAWNEDAYEAVVVATNKTNEINDLGVETSPQVAAPARGNDDATGQIKKAVPAAPTGEGA